MSSAGRNDVASLKFSEGAITFALRRATVFALGHRISKLKTTKYARMFGVVAPLTPLAVPMPVHQSNNWSRW